jgi:hypothetical protein
VPVIERSPRPAVVATDAALNPFAVLRSGALLEVRGTTAGLARVMRSGTGEPLRPGFVVRAEGGALWCVCSGRHLLIACARSQRSDIQRRIANATTPTLGVSLADVGDRYALLRVYGDTGLAALGALVGGRPATGTLRQCRIRDTSVLVAVDGDRSALVIAEASAVGDLYDQERR